jgi:hypothetical protein
MTGVGKTPIAALAAIALAKTRTEIYAIAARRLCVDAVKDHWPYAATRPRHDPPSEPVESEPRPRAPSPVLSGEA